MARGLELEGVRSFRDGVGGVTRGPTSDETLHIGLVESRTFSMAASMQRWAITPPAFDGDPNETEEIPLVDAPHGTMTHGSVSQSSGTLPRDPLPTSR